MLSPNSNNKQSVIKAPYLKDNCWCHWLSLFITMYYVYSLELPIWDSSGSIWLSKKYRNYLRIITSFPFYCLLFHACNFCSTSCMIHTQQNQKINFIDREDEDTITVMSINIISVCRKMHIFQENHDRNVQIRFNYREISVAWTGF